MCMPLSMNRIVPINRSWTEKCCAVFRSIIRGDIPIICKLEHNPLVFSSLGFKKFCRNQAMPSRNLEDKILPQNRRGVLNANNLRILTKQNDVSIDAKLVQGVRAGQEIAQYAQE